MSACFPRELAVLDEASRILAEARSLEEIKAVRDKAEAVRTYARAAKLGLTMQNWAAEVKLSAERKAGRHLASLKLRGGDRKSKRHEATLKLEDLGISRDQSRRWQRIASVSEGDFQQYLLAMKGGNCEVTSAGLLRFARRSRGKAVPAAPSTETPPTYVDCDGPQGLLEELMNHCRLLVDVLRPVYEEATPVELQRGERRAIGHLLREMTELIWQLTKMWPAAQNRPAECDDSEPCLQAAILSQPRINGHDVAGTQAEGHAAALGRKQMWILIAIAAWSI